MNADDLVDFSPQARRRRLIVTLIILALLVVYTWRNIPVEYYGRSVSVWALHEQRTASLYCAQKQEPQWYRDLAAFFPVIPRSICFDTQQEVTDYLDAYRTLNPLPTSTPTP